MKIIAKIDSSKYLVEMTDWDILRACGFSYSSDADFKELLKKAGKEHICVGLELDSSNAFRISDSVDRFVRAVRDVGEAQAVALAAIKGEAS